MPVQSTPYHHARTRNPPLACRSTSARVDALGNDGRSVATAWIATLWEGGSQHTGAAHLFFGPRASIGLSMSSMDPGRPAAAGGVSVY